MTLLARAVLRRRQLAVDDREPELDHLVALGEHGGRRPVSPHLDRGQSPSFGGDRNPRLTHQSGDASVGAVDRPERGDVIQEILKPAGREDHVHQARRRRLVIGHELPGQQPAVARVLHSELNHTVASARQLQPNLGEQNLLDVQPALHDCKPRLQGRDRSLVALNRGGVGVDRRSQLAGLLLMLGVAARQVASARRRADCHNGHRRDKRGRDPPASTRRRHPLERAGTNHRVARLTCPARRARPLQPPLRKAQATHPG